MTEKLLKGQFILALLGVIFTFVSNQTGHMDGTQAGMTMAGIIAAFLHFDAKDVGDAKP